MNPVRKAVVGAALAEAALTGGALGAALVKHVGDGSDGNVDHRPVPVHAVGR